MMIDDLRLTNLSGLAGKGAAMAFWIARHGCIAFLNVEIFGHARRQDSC